MSGLDGRILRELRERAHLGLGRVVSRSGLPVSVSHLSRVERGERRVTPVIVAAYEKALGIKIADTVDAAHGTDRIDDVEREAFTSTIGKLAAGGAPEESADRLLEVASGGLTLPTRIGLADVAHVEHGTVMVRSMDLRFGGGLVWQMAESLLRWAVGLHNASMTDSTRLRLDAATGALAAFAAWAAFDDARHRSARALFTVAFEAARRADEANLCAYVMADVAAHYNYLGHPDEGLTVLRLAGDERVGPAVECVLHGVKAHVYAARAEAGACAREVELAQVTCSALEPGEVPRWLGGFDPAHMQAVCGRALAVLAETTGREADRDEARTRLIEATNGLEKAGRARALGLCQTRLTMLHLAEGDGDEAARWARRAMETTAGMRSARARRELATVREAAATRLADRVTDELAIVLTEQIGSAMPPSA